MSNAVDVYVKNFGDAPKPPLANPVTKTTITTYILDPTGATGPTNVPISDYEPKRYRLAILVIDAACVLTMDSPNMPDAGSTISLRPSQGCYLPANTNRPYEFFGPDAFWLKALTGNPTRVTVIKEYC